MKKILFFIVIIFTCTVSAQDVIYKTDGTEISAKVVEITPEFIKYKKFSNPDGPTYNIAVSEIFMIVYANGEREVFKKNDTQAPVQQPQQPVQNETPPPARQPEPPVQAPPAQQTPQTQATYTSPAAESFQHTGLHASFQLGSRGVMSGEAEKKLWGETVRKWDLDGSNSQFSFSANAIWQSNQTAFVFGGVVNDYESGYMTYYYIGLNYYFNLDKFSPYGFARLGYGLGKFDDKVTLKDPVTLMGYYVQVGGGSKLYLGNSWGLTAELGFDITSFSADDKLESVYGHDVEYEYEESEQAFTISVGIFFYP